MTPLVANGAALAYGVAYDIYRDGFERGASNVVDELGGDWHDLSDTQPADYDPLGVLDGAVVVRGLARVDNGGPEWCPNPSNTSGAIDYDDHPGTAIPGIGAAWRETGTTSARVSVLWDGNWGPVAGVHTEATPGMHFTPGTTSMAIGAWIGFLPNGSTGVPIVACGTLGNPPELFAAPNAAVITHTHGTRRWVTLDSNGLTYTVWLSTNDDIRTSAQVSFNAIGTTPIAVPAELQGSSRHGICVDQHMVDYTSGEPDLARMQSAPALSSIEMILR